jgi:VWFA-related protein
MFRLLCAVAVVAVAFAPQQEQRPVFRSETRLIPVTVTVLDRQGRPVTGLEAADFKVFEDGSRREIGAFYPQDLVPGPVVEPSMAIVRNRQIGLTPTTRRTFLIVLGYGRIQHPTNALDGAMKFVREHLLPQDTVGVMALHRTTAITTDHRTILQVLERYKTHHERMVFEINEFLGRTRAGCGGPPIPEEMLAGFNRDLFEGLLPASPLRNVLDLLLGMDVGPDTAEKRWQVHETFKELLDRVEPCLNLADLAVTSGRIKVLAGIEYLRYLDGEKHLVFLGAGGITRSADSAKVLAARANDAGVVLDFVATRGTALGAHGGVVLNGCDPCRDVAERTGGLYTSLDYMDKALARIDQSSRSSYLLGYVPVIAAFDGTYREIRVEVNRPGVIVRHKHGYLAVDEPAPMDLKTLVQEARMAAATTYGVAANDIRVDIAVTSAPGQKTKGEGTVTAEVTVHFDALPLELVNGFRTGDLDVSVYCGDAKEKVVGQRQDRWALRADGATYDTWLKNGLRRTVVVPVTGPARFVKVVVYDRTSDRTGSRSVTIK